MPKKADPFNPVQTALKVRQGAMKLAQLTPEQQSAVRNELRSTGRLRTKLLRGEAESPSTATTLVPTTRFREAYSS